MTVPKITRDMTQEELDSIAMLRQIHPGAYDFKLYYTSDIKYEGLTSLEGDDLTVFINKDKHRPGESYESSLIDTLLHEYAHVIGYSLIKDMSHNPTFWCILFAFRMKYNELFNTTMFKPCFRLVNKKPYERALSILGDSYHEMYLKYKDRPGTFKLGGKYV